MGLSAAVGPVVGGGILELGSWRLIFLINIPLVVLALGCQVLLGHRETPTSQRPALDLAGALALAGVLALIAFFLGSAGSASAIELAVAGLLLLVLGALFLRGQLASKMPVAERSLFKSRSFAAATAFILLSNMVMYTTLLSVPFFIKEVQGRGEAVAGFLLGAMSIFMAMLALFAGRFSDRHGRWLPAASAVSLRSWRLSCFSSVSVKARRWFSWPRVWLCWAWASDWGPVPRLSPRESAAVASDTVSMTRYFGSIVGAGLLGSLLSQGDPDSVGIFRVLFGGMVGIAVLATLIASQIHDFVADPGAPGQNQTLPNL